MRLVSYDDGRVGWLAGDRVIPLHGRTMRDVIASWSPGGLAIPAHQDGIPLRDVRLGVPVADPSKIIAAPVNYRDHQAEMNQEGELALVIGRTARQVSEQDALSYVFGYTGLLDITMRGGEDRSVRKSFDTFTPMGPVLVTADEFGDPGQVELRCWVSGQLRQEASTRDLIWGVARLVSYASSVTTLHPGDVITTGTPAGVGPLTAGDTVRLELSGLGLGLQARVAADNAVASPTSGRDRGPVPPPAPGDNHGGDRSGALGAGHGD